jgi:hypothetical protein
LEGGVATGGLKNIFKTAELASVTITAAKPVSTAVKTFRVFNSLSKFSKVESLASLALHGLNVANDLLNSAITTTEIGAVTGHVLPTVTITVSRSNYRNYSLADARNGLRAIYKKYGVTMASNVERIYRLETTNFTSIQYRRTGTGGMEVHGPAPSYGWRRSFFYPNPQYAPIGILSIYEGKGLSESTKFSNKQVKSRPKQFLIMPSVEAGMMYLSDYIINHGGNFARWYSTDPLRQKTYKQNVLKRSSAITDMISQTQPNLMLPINQ